jgi:hypothetical protein
MDKFNASFSFNNSNQENRDLSGDIISLSLTNTHGTLTKIDYKIKPSGGLPFLRGVKLKSDIDLILEIKTNVTTTERKVGEEEAAVIKDDTSNSVSLNANYSFSQKFRGGAKMLFSSSKDITNKIHKVREVSIWCELRFN